MPDQENQEIPKEKLPDPEELAKDKKLAQITLHQRMLSSIVKVGYGGLNDEERAYWNSIY